MKLWHAIIRQRDLTMVINLRAPSIEEATSLFTKKFVGHDILKVWPS